MMVSRDGCPKGCGKKNVTNSLIESKCSIMVKRPFVRRQHNMLRTQSAFALHLLATYYFLVVSDVYCLVLSCYKYIVTTQIHKTLNSVHNLATWHDERGKRASAPQYQTTMFTLYFVTHCQLYSYLVFSGITSTWHKYYILGIFLSTFHCVEMKMDQF